MLASVRDVSRRIKEADLSEYFAKSALVPIPRSTPLVKGAVFPARIICETLVSNGLGGSNFENNKYIYHYKDQVGNIRVSFYKGSNGNAEIDDEVDFTHLDWNMAQLHHKIIQASNIVFNRRKARFTLVGILLDGEIMIHRLGDFSILIH